jgi:predicted amidophosphoribosyltransferase
MMRFTDAIGASSTGTNQNQNHVCAFCQTAFDSRERVCPVCNAEIVLRGDR